MKKAKMGDRAEMNDILKCPTCGSLQQDHHYQLHVGYYTDGYPIVWTTRKFREQNNLKPDSGQILVVPPEDPTMRREAVCRMIT